MPDQYEQGNPFYNKYMSGPDWGAGIRDILNQMWSYKELRRKEDEDKRRWEADQAIQQQTQARQDRATAASIEQSKALSKYYADQGLAALGRVNNVFRMSPVALRSLGKELDLPEDILSTVESMSPPAQEDFFRTSTSSLSQLRLEQKRQEGPLADAATERARLAGIATEERGLRERLKRQGGLVSGATTFIQQLRQPLIKQIEAIDKNIMLITEEEKANVKQPYQSALNNIDQAAGEIAALGFTLASGYELSDEAQKKIQYYLNNPKKIQTGEIWQQEQAPQVPLQGEPDPEQVQMTAREIINRAGRNGVQISEGDAIERAIAFLKSKQNVPR